ncbi:carbohydrate ABC transporter permease [Kerstersia sp.]|uniref:carbohydrate ABC transporter permease n=1 Tax=Kerstersia sp. TaxID=1930783 RepID=UPI003F92FFB0
MKMSTQSGAGAALSSVTGAGGHAVPSRRSGWPSRLQACLTAAWLENAGAWLLALLWLLPFAYAVWTAIHPAAYEVRFSLTAPLTLENFRAAWDAAPFATYMVNTAMLVTVIMAVQFVLCTLAAYAFARFQFPGRNVLFYLVLLQLMIMPEMLMVENYRTISGMGLLDSLLAIGMPYFASAFGIFLLRQTFLATPRALEDAARIEGAGTLGILWRVYVPLARPVYVAYGLVSISYHWNNLLWPLIVTNSVSTRPVTVGLQVFSSPDQGTSWAIISAATLLTSAPLLVAFLLFQKQFIQSFMRAGIK